jgi:hypothetical protein
MKVKAICNAVEKSATENNRDFRGGPGGPSHGL